MIRGVQLLIIVLRHQQLARQRWNLGDGEPGPRPRIGQVEMEPQPAVMAKFDRQMDRQWLGAAVAVKTKRPYQTRDRSTRVRYRRGATLCRLSQHIDGRHFWPPAM